MVLRSDEGCSVTQISGFFTNPSKFSGEHVKDILGKGGMEVWCLKKAEGSQRCSRPDRQPAVCS